MVSHADQEETARHPMLLLGGSEAVTLCNTRDASAVTSWNAFIPNLVRESFDVHSRF